MDNIFDKFIDAMEGESKAIMDCSLAMVIGIMDTVYL